MISNSRLQILANYCAAAAEAMGFTMMRTAYSTFVKETEDFSCQLMTPEGLTFASPITTGATWYTGLDYGPVIRMIDDYREGDVYAVNDPYSGFVATHTPDVHLWMPVFRDGQLVCFVGNHVHNTDMGGAVPASLSRTLTEVHQEGIRFPPVRIMRDGVLDERLLKIIDMNVRSPTQNRGDLDAQLACLVTGERKVHEIIDRFGTEEFMAGSQQLLAYAESQARQIIASIPDGEYVFSEFADEDSVDGVPCRINIRMTIAGDSVDLDYTGSDPQVVSSLNMPTGGNIRHSLITVGLIYSLHTLRPDALLNAGTVRILTGTLPLGTIVNPVAPAAVGMRSLISAVNQAAIFGLFSQAVPERMPACPAGGSSLLNVRAVASDGQRIIASIGPVGGGAGGGPTADGQEGCGANSAFLKNTPVEINEAEVPIHIIRYGVVPNTGGAGRWRGGNAAVMEFRMRTPEAMVTARNRNRASLAAWGVLGGKAGANARFTRNPGTDHAVELGNTDIVPCEPGDVIRSQGPGGGGYGHPFDRPVEAVLEDVESGFVSVNHARDAYGVIVVDGAVDMAATARLRGTRAAPEDHFDFGPNRSAFEAVWSRRNYDAMTEIMSLVPINWRHFVKHRLFRAAETLDTSLSPESIRETYAKLQASFNELPSIDLTVSEQ
ncbi:N-methylhydantoinase B [Pseudochelatococcus lubricantis]|uniref:N-methylhydantoinase B n=1 Tax=Pseudochelatococcus lubricantis TaxID=1538102 RepID=A0ABX0UZB8_9HYPH|nr:hydantoinase B/oxoprolinase family protein [Pseudochelatococcus lubricantis]NIJ56226.1 N-methylhydantoinase B [Pseudochelatococcus lubricantis]